MNKIAFYFLLFFSLIGGRTYAQNVKEQLEISPSKEILVVSHRADWRNAPENSLQAIQNCIQMGVDMIEIDLKKTKDGHLILMHDKTLNRTTTGKGIYTGRNQTTIFKSWSWSKNPTQNTYF